MLENVEKQKFYLINMVHALCFHLFSKPISRLFVQIVYFVYSQVFLPRRKLNHFYRSNVCFQFFFSRGKRKLFNQFCESDFSGKISSSPALWDRKQWSLGTSYYQFNELAMERWANILSFWFRCEFVISWNKLRSAKIRMRLYLVRFQREFHSNCTQETENWLIYLSTDFSHLPIINLMMNNQAMLLMNLYDLQRYYIFEVIRKQIVTTLLCVKVTNIA